MEGWPGAKGRGASGLPGLQGAVRPPYTHFLLSTEGWGSQEPGLTSGHSQPWSPVGSLALGLHPVCSIPRLPPSRHLLPHPTPWAGHLPSPVPFPAVAEA